MRPLATVLVLFTLLSASLASAQSSASTVESALDDERPPVRAPLTIDASFSLRAREVEPSHHGSYDLAAVGLYVTSITSFVVSLGATFAWVGFRAADTSWWFATLGTSDGPFGQQRDIAGGIALASLGLAVPTLITGVVLDVSSGPSPASHASLRGGCGPLDDGVMCSVGGTF